MGDSAIDEAKAELREQAHRQRAALGSAARSEAAKAAAAHFLDNVEIEPGQVVGGYWPIRDEIDCKLVLARLVDAGHILGLPVTGPGDAPLVFRQWEMGAPLYEAGFGTLAPSEAAPVVAPDVLIIPLLGFDKAGTRLGYGKGHYDRTIAVLDNKPLLIGYAFAAQELPHVPRDAHDVPMDILVTEAGLRRFDA